MGYSSCVFGVEREGNCVFGPMSVADKSDGVEQFLRDFLHPLLPVYACEYLALAPQRLSYEDLEVSSFLTILVFHFVDVLFFRLDRTAGCPIDFQLFTRSDASAGHG